MMSQLLGFRGAYLLARPTGEFKVLKFWDGEEQAKAWSQNPEHKRIGLQLTPLLIGNATHENYTVLAHATS